MRTPEQNYVRRTLETIVAQQKFIMRVLEKIAPDKYAEALKEAERSATPGDSDGE